MTENNRNATDSPVENFVENMEKIPKSDSEMEYSDRFKKRMNRLFREQVGKKDAMYPEVDTLFERVRSGIIRASLVAAHKVKKVFKR